MANKSDSFVDHMWTWIAHVITGHVLAMAREGLIGEDVADALTAAIDRVREQPALEEDLISLVRSFEQRLAAQVTPDVEAASRVGRSIVDLSAAVARLSALEQLHRLDEHARHVRRPC